MEQGTNSEFVKIAGNVLSETLIETINRISGINLIKENEFINQKVHKLWEVSGAMLLAGGKDVLLLISTDLASAKVLTMYITGTEMDQIENSEIYDCIAEIVNMTAGMGKTQLTGTESEFRLTLPFSLVGEELRIMVKKNVSNYQAVLIGDDIKLLLDVFCF